MEIISAFGEYYGSCKYENSIYFYKSIFDRFCHSYEMSYESLVKELNIGISVKELCKDFELLYIPTPYKIIENNKHDLGGEYSLLTEYIKNMIPLHKIVSYDERNIDIKLCKDNFMIIESIANCIEYLHNKNIVHGDLNFSNIQIFIPSHDINNNIIGKEYKIVIIDWESGKISTDNNNDDWMLLYYMFDIVDTSTYNKNTFLKHIKEKCGIE
ncbi:Lipopolysaccharide kinase [Orpheovirus IHUMI-LCC2]|uniref:Lipopolysaccharide kinase n=1 Tax=Orpheovirus IHUMI-LCC2 TaxID=2023057 RepID=A0A2I2L6C6_9VIRU|nr:Lipopolysaccharide kinase [Orpheovirus IHUMI-LCC2]SNW63093.1 Lipopolysaccharide kinase [Orpheovirus IHUMI-LCC2]